MKRFQAVLALCLLLTLTACGGGPQTPVPAQPKAPDSPLLAFLSANEEGASATLDDPEFGEGVRVLVDGRFFSATGEECKRATLTAENREAEVVVVCRQADGSWRLAPRIWGQGLSR